MWIYNQRSGTFSNNFHTFRGYAGCLTGKNNSFAEHSKGTSRIGFNYCTACRPGAGPLPRGIYTIEHPRPDAGVGRYAMPLIPEYHHGRMFGRNDFFIHGENGAHPGLSSDGCIILRLADRETIWRSKDHQLKVIK
jgi:hypothetical protein